MRRSTCQPFDTHLDVPHDDVGVAVEGTAHGVESDATAVVGDVDTGTGSGRAFVGHPVTVAGHLGRSRPLGTLDVPHQGAAEGGAA